MNTISSRQQGLGAMTRPGTFKAAGGAAPAQADPSSNLEDVIVVRRDADLTKGTPNIAISEEVAKDLKSQGAQVEDAFSLLPGASAKVDAGTVAHLKDEGYLVYDNRPRKMVPASPKHSGLPGRPKGEDDGRPSDVPPTPLQMPKVDVPALLKTDKVNKAGFTGKGVNVAVIDSGYDHPDVPLVAWQDFVDGSDTPIDPAGHGTHCASDVHTTAPDAGLIAIRVMNDKGEGRPSDIIRGIQWAIAHRDQDHIGVINLSLGGPPDGTPPGQDPIDRAVDAAWKAGIVVTTAAGNDGPNPNTIGSPSDDPHAITVGSALDPNHVSYFSSVGPTVDGKVKPDVMAPGEYIVGWAAPNSEIDQMATVMEKLRHMNDTQLVAVMKKNPDLVKGMGLPANWQTMPPADRDALIKSRLEPQYKPTPDTVAAPGTSFASPEMAGVAADLLQAKPGASPDDVKNALTSTAQKMGSQFTPNQQGAGFADAWAALQKLKG